MFGFKEKFKKIENDIITTNKNLQDAVGNISAFDSRIKSLETVMADYFDYLKRKSSEEPFIEVISESFSEETGIQMKLDWNDAMINYLKRNGYRGASDDEIIEKYVSDVFNDRAKNEPDQIT